MNFNKRQAEEIKTIRERNIPIKLSDADVKRISIKAGKCGLTVGELLEQFIGDLVSGTYSNGSDERDKAQQWFERCWFGMFPEETLLWHLLDWGRDVGDFLTVVDELKYFENNPGEFTDEVAELQDGEQLWFQEEYNEYVENYLENHKDTDIEKEIDACRKWFNSLKELGREEKDWKK